MAGNVKEYISPSLAGLLSRRTINLTSREMLGPEIIVYSSLTAAVVTPGQNGITHHPLILPSPFTINQMFWWNGTTVAGNTDIGVYNESGTLLMHSGPIANSGASVRQVVDVTDYVLPAGQRLWLSFGTDSATHQYTRFTLTAPAADFLGVKTMTSGISGSNLVSSATFSNGSNSALMCGITGAATI